MGVSHSMNHGQVEDVLGQFEATTDAIRGIEQKADRMNRLMEESQRQQEALHRQAEDATELVEHFTDSLNSRSDQVMGNIYATVDKVADLFERLEDTVYDLGFQDLPAQMQREFGPLLLPAVVLVLIVTVSNCVFGFLLAQDDDLASEMVFGLNLLKTFAIFHTVLIGGAFLYLFAEMGLSVAKTRDAILDDSYDGAEHKDDRRTRAAIPSRRHSVAGPCEAVAEANPKVVVCRRSQSDPTPQRTPASSSREHFGFDLDAAAPAKSMSASPVQESWLRARSELEDHRSLRLRIPDLDARVVLEEDDRREWAADTATGGANSPAKVDLTLRRPGGMPEGAAVSQEAAGEASALSLSQDRAGTSASTQRSARRLKSLSSQNSCGSGEDEVASPSSVTGSRKSRKSGGHNSSQNGSRGAGAYSKASRPLSASSMLRAAIKRTADVDMQGSAPVAGTQRIKEIMQTAKASVLRGNKGSNPDNPEVSQNDANDDSDNVARPDGFQGRQKSDGAESPVLI